MVALKVLIVAAIAATSFSTVAFAQTDSDVVKAAKELAKQIPSSTREAKIEQADRFRQLVKAAIANNPVRVASALSETPEMLDEYGLHQRARELVLEFVDPKPWIAKGQVSGYFEAARWVFDTLLGLDEFDTARVAFERYLAVFDDLNKRGVFLGPDDTFESAHFSVREAFLRYAELLKVGGVFEEARKVLVTLQQRWEGTWFSRPWSKVEILTRRAEIEILQRNYAEAKLSIDEALKLANEKDDNELVAAGSVRELLSLSSELSASGEAAAAIELSTRVSQALEASDTRTANYAKLASLVNIATLKACDGQGFSSEMQQAATLLDKVRYGRELFLGPLQLQDAVLKMKSGRTDDAVKTLLEAESNFAIRKKTRNEMKSGRRKSDADDGSHIHDTIELLPDYDDEQGLLFRLAIYHLKIGKVDKAQKYLETYFEGEPTTPDVSEQRLLLANYLILLGENAKAASLIEQVLQKTDSTADTLAYANHLIAMSQYNDGKYDAALWSLLEFYGSEKWSRGMFTSVQLRSSSLPSADVDIWELPVLDRHGVRLETFEDQTALFLKTVGTAGPRVEVNRLAFSAAQLVTKTRISVGASRSIIRQQARDDHERKIFDALYKTDRDVDEDIFASSHRNDDRYWLDSDRFDLVPCSQTAHKRLELQRTAKGVTSHLVLSDRESARERLREQIKMDLLRARQSFDSPIEKLAFGWEASISRQALQQRLLDGDAVVLITPTALGTYVGLVQKEGPVRSKFVKLSSDDLRRQVAALRSSLIEDPISRRSRPFDDAGSARIYDELFEGLFEQQPEFRRLFIVAGAAVSDLPFAALRGKCLQGNDVQWLSDCFQITMLPAVALYGLSGPSCCDNSDIGFLGVSAPSLSHEKDCEEHYTTQPGDNLADINALRHKCSVDRGADIVVKLSKTIGEEAKRKTLSGPEATEARIKALNETGALGKVRYIAFATHGLTAGETKRFSAVAEPSLVLTPPQKASETDDGLLLSSEIVTLRLSADIVYLIACNSAASDRDELEAFTGLAMSFMAAGAKALVVAYFPVDLDATALLMPKLAQHLVDDHATASQALQSAMRELRSESNGVEPYSHPRFWAAFTVISLQ